ncbi:unnamed protein product [Didymodactylos carnosus]|uniref:NAD(P)(+)--arginine ADP-ribosyltransferase n=1 Tax=Didymodactylos carnosus TaxID=1234261 RepID=A0A8S2F9D5_9BILA|nr:unnamed protein product [Didymodactylos carnosus]CAF4190997.1 unnamed protein product [Didymodactylos carnosus]
MNFNGDWYTGFSMKYNQSVNITGILQYDTIWRKIPCKFSSSMAYFYKQGKSVCIYAKHDQDKPVPIGILVTGTGIEVLIPATPLPCEVDHEQVFMIISGAFANEVVPLVHTTPQLYSIYIFCSDKTEHEIWINKFTKVKGLFTEIEPVCDLLKQHTKQCDRDLSPISILSPTDYQMNDLNDIEPSFMYTQLLKEILLDAEYEDNARQELRQLWRDYYHDNEFQLKIIDEFERDYNPDLAIWWYTREYFTYSMLNRALRTIDIDHVIKMGFFLCDIHRQIQRVHAEASQIRDLRTVYRGQGMYNIEFEKLQKSIGGILSFNNFLSTSTDRQVSLLYAQSSAENSLMIGILFEIHIDIANTSTPFASLENISYFSSENEILFSMHSTFRIGEMRKIDERVWQVQLISTNNNDEQLKTLTELMRKETSGNTEYDRLGRLMIKMGEFDIAEEIYQILLDEAVGRNEKELAHIYHQIGRIKDEKGDYDQAFTFYQKTLEIKQNDLSSNQRDLADIYTDIGVVYKNIGDYVSALSFYQKSLEIDKKCVPIHHRDLATIHSNIGGVYLNMGDYSSALSFYEQTLEIEQQSLPDNHPSLATTFSNIGLVYDKIGDDSNALSFYQKSLEIQQRALLPNHPSLATTYNNIGGVHYNMGDYSNALLCYEKALEIRQKSLPSNHPSLATIYSNIGVISHNDRDDSTALLFFQKALEIQKQSLSLHHPSLATTYNNIGGSYKNLGDYTSAIAFYQKAIEVHEKHFSSNHPGLATFYSNIGIVYNNMGDYSNALSLYQKALEIRQKSLSSNHRDLAVNYKNIGEAYENMKDYSRALSFFEHALQIGQNSLPENHTHLKIFRQCICNMQEKLQLQLSKGIAKTLRKIFKQIDAEKSPW